MSDTSALFAILRQSADATVAEAIERHIAEGSDRALNRINVLTFAAEMGLDENATLSGFLHATRLGLFDLSWNVLCPGCGGVLDARSTLKSIHQADYSCALCAAGYEPTLDDIVEVTFTVARRVRQIAAHTPDTLSIVEYFRQIFWSTGIDLPETLGERLDDDLALDWIELPAGEKASLSLRLEEQFLIVFDPVTHAAQFIEVKGEPTTERRKMTVVFNKVQAQTGTLTMAPGPLRLFFENDTDRRVLPGVWIAGDALHDLLGKRRPFLNAKRLLTCQTFIDLFGAETMEIDQRLKITSLSLMFTDLKGSTQLYERVGDIAAYDIVRAHFGVLQAIIASETGAVVKTIGDAVMATFPTPDRALSAALRIRRELGQGASDGPIRDLVIKIGIHEGPCLAVTLNGRQDYFGQTVNVAARVQKQVESSAICVTRPVAEDAACALLLDREGLTAVAREHRLPGLSTVTALYEIP